MFDVAALRRLPTDPAARGRNCRSIHRLFEIPGVDKQSRLVVRVVSGILRLFCKGGAYYGSARWFTTEGKLYNSAWISCRSLTFSVWGQTFKLGFQQ